MNEGAKSNIDEELERFRQRYRQLNRQIGLIRDKPGWHTANKVILERGSMRVRRFQGARRDGAPVLIVYSHVNRPCIIDLQRDHSLVQRLIECGHRVYLVDWGDVRECDRTNDLSVYVNDYIDEAVDGVMEDGSRQRVNLLGICQGGTFALCYASLHPDKVNRLVTLVTPIDFHRGDGVLPHWARHVDFSILEDNPRNIPGEVITALFQGVRPFEDLRRQVALIEQPAETRKMDLVRQMDQWIFDCPDQPGKAFAQFAKAFFQGNKLVTAELTIGNRSVELAKVDMPVLNVYATKDHLVPPESASALGDLIQHDNYRELQYDGGHIGLLVSRMAQQTTLPEIGRWLAGP